MTLDIKTVLKFLPKELQDAATGIHSDEYVLFLDLWGTSAALEKYSLTKDILDRAEIAHIQSHFVSTLGRLSNQFPTVRTTQASDCSFSFSENFEDLISFASSTFKCMTHRGTNFFLVPIRGGISKGLVHIQDGGTLSAVSNFKYTSEIGIGMVESAHLEKRGEKGMRLFAPTSLSPEIPSLFQKSYRATQDRDGKSILEVNWTHPDNYNTTYLGNMIGTTSAKDFLTTAGKSWLAQGNKFQQDIGRSLNDLLIW
jgi:hypothetical protein